MTLEQFKDFLDTNGLHGLPPSEGAIYTRFFVELSGFDYDWTICADVYDLNVFGLYARWRFKAQTVKQALMMIEAQMFNLLLHRHWRKTRVTCWCGLFSRILI